jgi:hypothetical protein
MITIPPRPKAGPNHAPVVRVALFVAFAALTVWSMYANCQEECNLVVQGHIGPAVSISVSPDLVEWNDMYPGANTFENAVTVTMFSNVNYKATINCTMPYLSDPEQYELLSNPLEWKCSDGDFWPVSVTPATIRLGGPTAKEGDLELISFRQVVEYSDPLLDASTPYTMTLRFAIEPRL